MPGYTADICEPDESHPHYICNLCILLLREAMQTSCGHLYCSSCLDELKVLQHDAHDTYIRCLVDQAVVNLEDVFPDTFRRREIMQLVVQCTYVELGCNWKGEVRHFEMHTNNCEFRHVPSTCCTTCGMLAKKSALKEHLEKECKFRLHKCSYCKKDINLNLMQEHHSRICESIPVRCRACNKEGIKRGELKRHRDPIEGDCEATQVEAVGCKADKSMKRTDTKRGHLNKLLAFALDLERKVQNAFSGSFPGLGIANLNPDYQSKLTQAISKIDEVFNDITDVRQKLHEHSTRITTLETKFARHGSDSAGGTASAMFSSLTFPARNGILLEELSRRLVNLENRVADHEVLICDGGRNMNGNQQQAHGLQRQLEAAQNAIRRLERKVESHDHVLATRNVALADLEEYVRQQQVSSYDGALLWKIPDYARKKNDAVSGRQTSFYSACFYTSRHGYKMCARLYLNGDGMGKGTHISVFLVVMRGQFDALLRWPFRQKVTIMLLDQDNVEHVIDAFRPDPNSSSFQRPRREMNVASGCPLFCSQSELSKHAYVRDDVMFMKIIVDTSDL